MENKGRLAIVGSQINWEIVKSDGTIYNHRVGSANPRAFLGGNKATQTTLGAAIPPHSTRFVSLIGSAAEGEQLDLDNAELNFQGSQSELQEFKQALLQGNREEAFNKSFIAKLMADATSITVSVDGIFFEDGTFVGENKTGIFEKVKAYVDAEYDLVTEISAAQKQRKTPDDIVTQVTNSLSSPLQNQSGLPLLDKRGAVIEENQKLTALASIKPSTDAYQNYNAMAARTLLKKKERFGADEAVRQSLELLKEPRVELRRK